MEREIGSQVVHRFLNEHVLSALNLHGALVIPLFGLAGPASVMEETFQRGKEISPHPPP